MIPSCNRKILLILIIKYVGCYKNCVFSTIFIHFIRGLQLSWHVGRYWNRLFKNWQSAKIKYCVQPYDYYYIVADIFLEGFLVLNYIILCFLFVSYASYITILQNIHLFFFLTKDKTKKKIVFIRNNIRTVVRCRYSRTIIFKYSYIFENQKKKEFKYEHNITLRCFNLNINEVPSKWPNTSVCTYCNKYNMYYGIMNIFIIIILKNLPIMDLQ